ncbi:thymidylate synthase [Larsenimonas rhizosphaerae]|uniref:thymidylate synthase n=1 Tax=Larsenimonas rhizosphaerae TaxID=2944682 RepID=A0AA41ZF45_9GAMM|nr:thymidylate synthase [Larsenimonas rhizosphaerae]MCX2522738.1 thymidylate synthase [Larsenimonas rhizosphaerae]
MKIYSGESVEKLYKMALEDSFKSQVISSSRIGDVFDLGPVCFELDSNVINFPLLQGRGLNPFFLFAEAAWVIDGRDELDILRYYLDGYGAYSDDGMKLNGAYGYRIKHSFGFDQLVSAIEELKKTPDSRRVVVSLYSPVDLKAASSSKDIPCNLSVLLKLRNGKLDMTVFNRSNDIYKGVPYNLFIFQFIQFYVAEALNVPLGVQRHVSDSLHLYKTDMESVKRIIDYGFYENVDDLKCRSGFSVYQDLVEGCSAINNRSYDDVTSPSLKSMFKAFQSFKQGDRNDLLSLSKSDDIIGLSVSDWLMVHYS